ncbi:P-loop containing nucleoside triphosphate hydrolase protein [Mycena metata]|uniref:P-loop containing nucleoside triphosphate hydrolase protein n=1 Tax=Mycena metata TaxID=1033252 RepID=A0AAD7HJI8_9AGAR|nr:P-loop containing nucleoside triphosphate hydrolase protein [Mycena metata]
MYLFHDEVQAFVADWQGKDHTTIDDGVIRLLSTDDPAGGLKDWLEGGKDLGVESFCKLTAIQLEDLLGAAEGRFPTFQKHVAEKFAEYRGDQDVEIPGVTRVFALRHHQLVAIAAILTRAVNPPGLSRWPPKQPNVTDASPLVLRQHWGSLPGHWLADTVGLGKTWTGAGLIAAYINLFSFSQGCRREDGRAMPHILGTEGRFKFGPCDEIPNAPHIVVVPGSLLGQWGDQLKHMFKANAAAIRVIRVAKKHWAKDMEVSPNVLPVNTIYVVGLTTLVRMAKEAGISGHPPEFRAPPTRDDGMAKERTLFNMSFGVCIADEAHEFRKGNSAHQAMWAFSDLCLITVLASATPLIEGLADVHEQARIIRPRGLTAAVNASLTTQLALVKKIRSRSHVDRAADLEAFMKATSTEAATEGENADAEKPLTAVKAQRRGIERLKEICLRNTIRRTGQSATPDGKTITGLLPPSTFIHVVFEPSKAEVDASRALEETNVTEGRLETVRQVDVFYNEARKYLSFPPGIRTTSRTMTVDARPAGQPLSKLSVLTELIIKTLRDGPQTMVAADVLGTNTKILQASDMGLPNVAAEDYQPAKLLEGEGLNEKVVVFTQYAQFHPVMKVYLESAGISVATVSGAMPAKQRHEVITNFAGSNKQCLILSNVGSTGVDLTFARNLVIYEQLWSGVLTNQMLGHVGRDGQTRPTFCWSLAGQGTIDMLLMLMALRKASIVKDYMTLDWRAGGEQL